MEDKGKNSVSLDQNFMPGGPLNVLPSGEIISNSQETSTQREMTIFETDRHGFTLALIEEIKNYPCLFDMKDPLHSNKEYKDSIWAHLGQKFNLSALECQTRWNSLRRQYRRERMFRAQGDVGKKRPRRSWAFYDYMHFLRNCLNEKRLHPVSDEFEDSSFMEKSDFNEDENDDSYLTPNEQISSILTDNFYGQSQPQISIKNEVMENSTIEHDRNMDTSNISSSQSIHLENSEEGTSNNSAITSSYASQNPSFNSYSNIMPSGEALINSGDPITIVSHNGNNMSNQAQPSQLPPDSTRFTKIRPSGRILPSSQSSSHYSTPITSGAASAKAKPNNNLSMNFDETLDADLAFGRAVGLELQRLDEYQKGVAKIRIQQVLLDARFRTSPNSGL